MRVVQVAQGQQGLDALGRRLADADQDARGEGDRQLAGAADHRQPGAGALVGCALVGPAGPAEPLGDRLQHHPLAGRHLAQLGQLAAAEDAGVGVRQQAGLLQHQPAHGRQVGVGGAVAEAPQGAAVALIARLGAVAEGEEGLLAAQRPPGLGHRQHLVGAHRVGARVVLVTGEGAVGADVPAEVGQRDEDLARVGDPGRAGAIAQGGRRRPEGRVLGAGGIGEGEGLGARGPAAVEGRLHGRAQRRPQCGEARVGGGRPHQPGSGPWPSRNLRQSAGRFSWKEAIPSLGSGPQTWLRATSSSPCWTAE